MLRWGLQEGRSVIPKSTKPGRIAENIDVFDFELAAQEITAIDRPGHGPSRRSRAGRGHARGVRSRHPRGMKADCHATHLSTGPMARLLHHRRRGIRGFDRSGVCGDVTQSRRHCTGPNASPPSRGHNLRLHRHLRDLRSRREGRSGQSSRRTGMARKVSCGRAVYVYGYVQAIRLGESSVGLRSRRLISAVPLLTSSKSSVLPC